MQARVRNELGKAVYARDENGEILFGKNKKGVPLSDVWTIPFLNPKAKERAGYPTQKPILLLERIIRLTTDEGDRVLDPFCGSGTTLVAAKILGRAYTGIDISEQATELAEQRLREPIKTESYLLEVGEEGFLDKSDYERAILKTIDAIPVERNSGIDGFLKSHINGHPVSVKIQKKDEDFETAKQKLIAASETKNCELMILIRTHRRNDRLFSLDVNEANVLVIDSHDLIVEDWLQEKV